jgi:hypothetical protein
VTIEPKEINRSRQGCFGIILEIHRNASGVDCITTTKLTAETEKKASKNNSTIAAARFMQQ